jgi:hypothetical protein
MLLAENKNLKKAIVFPKVPFAIIDKIHFMPMYNVGLGENK